MQDFRRSSALMRAWCRLPPEILRTALCLTEHQHKIPGGYGGADDSGYVGAHGVHQKEVGRIFLGSDGLGYTGCHGNCGYACGTDQRVDLSSGQRAKELSEQDAAHGRKCEGQKAQDRKSTRLNSSHTDISRMPSSA